MSKVQTPEFRVAFPSVFQSKKNDLNGKNEYSVVALFPKGADLSKLKKAAQDAFIKKFGDDKSKWPAKWRSPFRDQGDRKKIGDDGKESLPSGYVEGAIYLTLRSEQKPGVVNQSVEDIIDTSDFYGGCWALATVNAYAYDQMGNRGVSFGLGNLQKLRDDDAFGNRTKPQDDFTAVAMPEGDQANAQSSSDLFK